MENKTFALKGNIVYTKDKMNYASMSRVILSVKMERSGEFIKSFRTS